MSYSEEDLQKAVEDYRSSLEKKELKKIAHLAVLYNVPETTLRRKIIKNENTYSKRGPKFLLDKKDELKLVRWILKAVLAGLPPTKQQICDYVRSYLSIVHNRTKPVSNKWFKGLMKRYPQLKCTHAQFLTKANAAVTKQDIIDWFK